MNLVEVALLGVRNFQQITRLEFRPGLNFVQGPNASGKSTLCEAILLSLFSGSPEQAKSLIQPDSPSTCQTALTFKLSNGEVYRLAKDFIKDIAVLSRHDPTIKKFIPIEKRRENILRWLQQQHEGLDGPQISRYFLITRDRMPSARDDRPAAPRAEMTATAGPLTETAGMEPAAQTMAAADPSEDLEAKERRLQDLKGLIKGAEEAFQLDEQLADIQSRISVLKRKLSQLKDLNEELARIDENAQAFSAMEENLDELDQIVDEFESKQAERDREHHDLMEDQTLLEHQLAMIPSDPIYKNKIFLSGAVITVLSFATGIFATLPGFYQHLYLIGLLTGLGLMVASVIVDMQWLSRKKIMEEKLGGKLKNLELLEARFRRENAKFFELLRRTETDSVEAFKEKMKAFSLIHTSRERLREQRERALEGKDVASLEREFEEKRGQAAELEQKLKAFEGVPTDLPTLREEISILEREVAFKKPAPAGAAAAPEHMVEQTSTQLPAENGRGPGPAMGFLTDPIVRDKDQLLSSTREIFLKLSQGAFQDLKWDGSDRLLPVAQNAAAPMPIEELSSGIRDTLYLSLYLGWIRNLAGQYPFPLFLDEPILSLDPQRQRMAIDLIRDIGRNRQVILISHQSYPVQEGENLIRL